MFDFPQPGELFRSAGFPDVRVVGILADGIPWEMPYRCPTLIWDPFRRTYTILIRIISDGRIVEIPLGRFMREFTCDRPDMFKRSPENRHVVLKDIAADPELHKWREKNIDNYQQDIIPIRHPAPVARKWQDIPRTEPDNSYRHYL